MNKILVVGCIHGNERFGYDLINAIKCSDIKNRVDTIIGNPKALHLTKRCIDDDLNRCFGDMSIGLEGFRAKQLKKIVDRYDYVLDMHNTNTTILNVPIVTKMGSKTKELLRLHPSSRVILIEEPFASKSLIGYKGDGAVSFEYNREYARVRGIQEMMLLIRGLIDNDSQPPKTLEVFYVKDTIAMDIQLGMDDINFVYSGVIDGYGILVGENAYKAHQGFRAYKKEVIEL